MSKRWIVDVDGDLINMALCKRIQVVETEDSMDVDEDREQPPVPNWKCQVQAFQQAFANEECFLLFEGSEDDCKQWLNTMIEEMSSEVYIG